MATDRKQDVLNQLTDGITNLTSSSNWRAWLKIESRFYRYSFTNALLIQLQRPGSTQVAGFQAWRKLGRTVSKGEKAIWIFAPVTRKAAADADDEACEPSGPGRVVVGFKPVAVFDVSQTDGDAIQPVCVPLRGDGPGGIYDGLVAVAGAVGFSVAKHELPRGVHGRCYNARRLIHIQVGNDELQQIKTLAHEIAHALLHPGFTDRPLAELEAESVAYAVCHNLGVDSRSYSFGYLATWAGGGPEAVDAIKASGGRIQRAVNQILEQLGPVR